LKWLLVLLVVVAAGAIFFRKPVQDAVLLRSLLMSDAASEMAFLELADGAKDRFALLQRVWNTHKIPHRALVATYLKDNAGAFPDLYRRAESLLFSATKDVDASVRELAMATLAQQKHAALARLAAALLRDSDPQMRLLGVQYLRKQDAAIALPLVFNLLDDHDPRVVTTADAALRNWTKQDFKIRVAHANLNASGINSSVEPANLKIIQEGVQRWKEWWNSHQQDYPANGFAASAQPGTPDLLPMADFRLQDLKGKIVRFSDFKGKVVLLNFWTTWCAGCLVEIPDLIELQKQNADRLVILGISLDGQTELDEHGDLVARHSHDGPGHNRDEPDGKVDFAELRAEVEQVVKGNGMNYPVLLDPNSDVGRRFNGGELPVNVMIDTHGYVRRRFTGGRTVAAFEAMIEELASPKYRGKQ